MRTSFFKVIEGRYKTSEEIFVLTADLGFKLFDGIRECCPERLYDMGVAEANMIGTAAGLALTGKKVFCYSIIPFLIMRAYEQIRIDIDYHDLDVKLIGVGGGFTYGLEGITHFGLEDIALMASLEKMKIIVPADPVEGAIVAEYALAEEGPVYIRLGRTGEPVIHSKRPLIEIGKGLTLQTGEKVAVIATGSMVKECMDSAEILRGSGIDITLINMHTIKPIDGDLVREVGENHEFIFTVEEHNIHGGLGSMVGNLLAEQGYGGYFRRIGIRPFQKRLIGDCEYLRRECGLCSETIAHNITSIVKR